MKSSHLLEELALARRIVERATGVDAARAKIELGGYVETLVQHPVGRSLVRRWATEFRRGLQSMVEARDRVVTRLRDIREVILASYSRCAVTFPDQDKIKSELESLERVVEKEWLGQQDDETSAVSILFEPLRLYSGTVEWALFHAQEYGIDIDIAALRQLFCDAIRTGDAGDIDDILEALRIDRTHTLRDLEPFRAEHLMGPLIVQLETFQIPDVDAGVQYVLERRPGILAASKKARIELHLPQLDLFLILGGQQALASRRSSLGPGPRHPWWSLVRLVLMARHSSIGVEAVSNGDMMLTRVASAIAAGQSTNPHIRRIQELAGIAVEDKTPSQNQLLLELEKVHLSVSSYIEMGAAIEADLLRYRQRAQWYHPADLTALIANTEQFDAKKLSEREKAAVQHLAVWLFDQGYVPLSKTLGRGRTDLEEQRHGEAFLIEAKIFTQSTFPRTQAAMDNCCRAWVNQALEYADAQGLDRAYVVVFNASVDSQMIAALPAVVADRLTIQFCPISVTEKPPSKMKGSALVLRWQQEAVATSRRSP